MGGVEKHSGICPFMHFRITINTHVKPLHNSYRIANKVVVRLGELYQTLSQQIAKLMVGKLNLRSVATVLRDEIRATILGEEISSDFFLLI